MGNLSFFSSLFGIIVINLVLSGDNAVVIALATLKLQGKEKAKGIFWGTFGAVILRIVLTLAAAVLLKIPFVQAVGGLSLIVIAIKLLTGGEDGDSPKTKSADNLAEAIKVIIFADLIMSLDNILAIAGAAGGNIALLIIGLILSIPIVIFGSSLISACMKKWSWLVSVGAGLIGYTAGDMFLNDSFFCILKNIKILEYLIPLGLAALVIILGNYLKYMAKKKATSKLTLNT
jgi:YjbE family integral membrane protein